jgi:hypothetical protein
MIGPEISELKVGPVLSRTFLLSPFGQDCTKTSNKEIAIVVVKDGVVSIPSPVIIKKSVTKVESRKGGTHIDRNLIEWSGRGSVRLCLTTDLARPKQQEGLANTREKQRK